MNSELKSISDWVHRNRLKLNVSKSQAIVIYRRDVSTVDFPPLLLNGISIPFKSTVVNLGMVFNKCLTYPRWSNCSYDLWLVA